MGCSGAPKLKNGQLPRTQIQKTGWRRSAQTKKKAREPGQEFEKKTQDGIVGLFKKRRPFKLACSPKAGLSTSSLGYFVRTENIQALPKKRWRRWVKERWRFKMTSLARFGGIRPIIRVFCQDEKTPGTPKLSSVYIVRVQTSRPAFCHCRGVDGHGVAVGMDPGQEFENKMASLGLELGRLCA